MRSKPMIRPTPSLAIILLLSFSLPVLALSLPPSPSFSPSARTIVPGANWTASDGSSIQAHAPGMLVDPRDGSFWWYGESEKVSDAHQHGVNCYHSTDLLTWTTIGQVVRQTDVEVPGQQGPFVIERPKVLYNALSDSYVMWFHLDNSGYSMRRVGVSVSFAPQGPFRFVRSFQPDGLPSLDMSLYEDWVNGTVLGAYFVRSVDNSYVGVSALSPDYLSTAGLVSVIPEAREGHAIFHHGERYYMLTSHLTGWNPNAMEAFITNKDSLTGAIWSSLGNPTNDSISFNSQPALVLPYTSASSGRSYFIYLGDRWVPNLLNASYIWLPIEIQSQTQLRIRWRDSWDLDNPFNDREGKAGGSRWLGRS